MPDPTTTQTRGSDEEKAEKKFNFLEESDKEKLDAATEGGAEGIREEAADTAAEAGVERAEKLLGDIDKTEEIKEGIEQIKQPQEMGAFEQGGQESQPSTSPKKDDDEEEEQVQAHAKDVLKMDDPEAQVERIVKLSEEKGPEYGIKIAEHLNSNYILDEVQGGLMSLRELLIKKGFLKEVK